MITIRRLLRRAEIHDAHRITTLPPRPGDNLRHVTVTTVPYDWNRHEPPTPAP